MNEVIAKANEDAPEGISFYCNGGAEVGKQWLADKRVPLVSATGSTRMGKVVGESSWS